MRLRYIAEKEQCLRNIDEKYEMGFDDNNVYTEMKEKKNGVPM